MKKIIISWLSILLIPSIYANSLDNLDFKIYNTNTSIIPRNGVNISFLKILITAKNEDIYIKSLILKRTGLSDPSDIKSVRAKSRFKKSFLGRVNNNDQVKLRFLRPILIKKGSTEEFEITANLDTRIGRTIGFDLIEIETTSTTKKINAQIQQQATKNISSFQTSQLIFKPLGDNNARLKFGQNSRIGRFRIQNESTKNITLQHLILENKGTARLNETFEQLELRKNTGELLSISDQLTQKQASFTFNNINFYGGEGLTLDIWGTVIGGRSGRTIELTLDEADDLTAFLSNSNTTTDTKSDSENLSKNILDFNTLNISRTPTSNFLWNQNYNPGSKDIIFLSQNIRHKAPIFIEDVIIFVSSGSIASDKDGNGISNEINDFESTFQEINLYINGKFQDQTDEFELISGQLVLRFHCNFDLYNTANFMITGKTSYQANTGDRLRLTIDSKKSFPDWELLR